MREAEEEGGGLYGGEKQGGEERPIIQLLGREGGREGRGREGVMIRLYSYYKEIECMSDHHWKGTNCH